MLFFGVVRRWSLGSRSVTGTWTAVAVSAPWHRFGQRSEFVTVELTIFILVELHCSLKKLFGARRSKTWRRPKTSVWWSVESFTRRSRATFGAAPMSGSVGFSVPLFVRLPIVIAIIVSACSTIVRIFVFGVCVMARSSWVMPCRAGSSVATTFRPSLPHAAGKFGPDLVEDQFSILVLVQRLQGVRGAVHFLG